ncbi:MAG TPA: methyltransferase domain-containing protein [Acidimicrobiales bacterium]|nr:methyltransferase domain-containing protein [Acidimicrobiales bacterium]
MAGTFAGETAEYYVKYRRGYTETTVAAVVNQLHLGPDDAVIDLGCGTGLFTLPLARRVRLVVGVDPEADMLSLARQRTETALSSKVVWCVGSDDDLPALTNLLGEATVGAVTVAQALHFMNHEQLFPRARRLLRPGGGLAVIANGAPMWQQDSEWSRCLRTALDTWFQTTTTATCGTDRATQARYAEALTAAGYEVHELVEEYGADLTLDEVLGGVYSALSPGDVAAHRRDAFAEHITNALPDLKSFTETVRVDALIGVAH